MNLLGVAVLLSLSWIANVPPQRGDSVRTLVEGEYRAGRHWHGVRLLERAMAGEPVVREDDLLLLAEGHIGWGAWEKAREVLEGREELGEEMSPGFWYYLGRAREGRGDWPGAAEAYDRALDGWGELTLEEERALETALRRGRVLGLSGSFGEAHARLDELRASGVPGVDWVAISLARRAAGEGAMETTRSLLGSISSREVRRLGWELPARALLAAGDSVGSEAAYWSAIRTLESREERQRAWGRVGELRLSRGDSLGARGAFHQVLLEPGMGPESVGAAARLLSLGFDSVAAARRGAEALAGVGRNREALSVWSAYERLRGGGVPPDVSLALARIHLALGDASGALGRLEEVSGSPEPAVGGPALALRARTLRVLGRTGEALAAEDTLIARFPRRREGVEILFRRAEAAEGRGDLPGAVRAFQTVADHAPAHNLAGEARVRMGMIHLRRGEEEAAVEVFQGYLTEFPEGRRWDQVSFWAGRTLLSLGREEDGTALLGHLRERFSLSYYTVMADGALGERYRPSIPGRTDSLLVPEDLRTGLERLKLLLAAELEEGAAWVVDELREMGRAIEAEEDRRGFLLSLARELNTLGLTREGINLGWEVRRLGEPWSRELMAAVYPFPYREVVLREAEEAGLDPFLVAGLIRQESSFWREAVSRADARGLMQVLPTTGAELARTRGPDGFDAEEHLFRPEVNVHLGVSFLADLRRRFGEDLSILLSAYNAGPTRARRWREFPEAGDLPLFVERIPFSETRGYVKNVLLNREIYAWLYGASETGPRSENPNG